VYQISRGAGRRTGPSRGALSLWSFEYTEALMEAGAGLLSYLLLNVFPDGYFEDLLQFLLLDHSSLFRCNLPPSSFLGSFVLFVLCWFL